MPRTELENQPRWEGVAFTTYSQKDVASIIQSWMTSKTANKPRNLPDKSCTHRADEKRMVAVLVAGVSMGTPPIKGTPARGSPVTRCKARASTVFVFFIGPFPS